MSEASDPHKDGKVVDSGELHTLDSPGWDEVQDPVEGETRSAGESGEVSADNLAYNTCYYGHPVKQLEMLAREFRHANKRIIWLVGDSTIDNKYWIANKSLLWKACNGYEKLLSGEPGSNSSTTAMVKPDVGYWVNRHLVGWDEDFVSKDLPLYELSDEIEILEESGGELKEKRQLVVNFGVAKTQPTNVDYLRQGALSSVSKHFVAVNCAVEASKLGQKQPSFLTSTMQLNEHDKIVYDNIQKGDILVTSIGGNDIAIHPTLPTIANMAAFLASGGKLGVDYFKNLFGHWTKKYLEALIPNDDARKPSLILVNILYYPDTNFDNPGGYMYNDSLNARSDAGWADGTLKLIGYQKDPQTIQGLIEKCFRHTAATLKEVKGVKVVHAPLYEVLNGKDSRDYDNKVEPSVTGGMKTTRLMLEKIREGLC